MRTCCLGALLLGACHEPSDSAPPDDSAQVREPWAEIDAGFGSLVRVCWRQEGPDTCEVAFREEGRDWQASPTRERGAGRQEQLLLGLPYGVDVEWELRCASAADPLGAGSLQTGAQPENLPAVRVLAADPALQDPGMPYLLGSVDELGKAGTSVATWVFILDREGRYVWARRTEDLRATLQPQVSRDGRALLVDLNSFWAIFDRGEASQVGRVTLDGRIEVVWDTPGLHHPFSEPVPGTIAYGAWNNGVEQLVEVDAKGGQRVLWDCRDFHAAAGVSGAQCSSNTLRYDPARGSFLFSFYTTNTVVEIAREGGATLRWFGEVPGGWSFDPKEAQFLWQHGAHWTEAGTLLLSTRAAEDQALTVVREYAPDEARAMLTQTWTCGAQDGIHAPNLGEAWRLPGGNTLHNLGDAVRLREYTPDCALAWDLTFEPASTLLRTEPLPDLWALEP